MQLTPLENQLITIRYCKENNFLAVGFQRLPEYKDGFYDLLSCKGVSDFVPELFFPEIGLWVRLKEPTKEQREYDKRLSKRYEVLKLFHHYDIRLEIEKRYKNL